MQKLEFAYKTILSGGGETEEFTEPFREVRFSTSGASKGATKVSEDEVIQVNVKWDDVEESFELHNNSK